MEQKNGIAATAQDILTHHLNSFGDIAGTMADYTAESRFFTTASNSAPTPSSCRTEGS